MRPEIYELREDVCEKSRLLDWIGDSENEGGYKVI